MNFTYNAKHTTTVKRWAAAALALSLLLGGGLALPSGTVHAAAQTTQHSPSAAEIIATAKQYMGVPYEYGAKAGQTNTFDCSSFAQFVFAQNGVSIPRSSKDQSQAGTYVSRSELKPGDLVFFYTPVHHVAIYIGGGKIIHTYGNPGVTITDLDSGWWNDHYTTARRVLPDSAWASSAADQQQPSAGQAAAPQPAAQTQPAPKPAPVSPSYSPDLPQFPAWMPVVGGSQAAGQSNTGTDLPGYGAPAAGYNPFSNYYSFF